MVALNDNAILADRTIQLAHAATRDSMKVSDTFGRYADDTFKGRGNEPVFMRVQKPTFQVREYALYNNREQPIQMDFMEEQLVQLNVEKNRIYSATALRDEVRDFDLNGSYGDMIYQQSQVMAQHFEHTARGLLNSAPYEYVKHVDYSTTAIKNAIALNQDVLYNAIVDARAALSRMASPLANTIVYAVAGSDWAGALRKNQKLQLVTGDNRPTAFADASLGTYAGVHVIEDQDIEPNALYLYTGEAFLAWSAAPSIAAGAVRGAQLTSDKLAMTWIQDYDAPRAVDRSILWSYTAFGNTLDFVAARDTNGGLVYSDDQYFIRGAKLILGSGTDVEPGSGKGDTPGADPESILAKLYKREPVAVEENQTVFADLTYQNIVDGDVAAGAPGELTVTDKVKRTRRTKAEIDAAETPAEIPADNQ